MSDSNKGDNNLLPNSLLKIKEIIINYGKYLFYIGIVFLFIFMGVDTVNNFNILCSNKKNPITVDNKLKPYDANYSSDMNFLECIGEQHSCLYKNLNNNIDYPTILEKCKDEKYCNQNSRAVHVRIPK